MARSPTDNTDPENPSAPAKDDPYAGAWAALEVWRTEVDRWRADMDHWRVDFDARAARQMDQVTGLGNDVAALVAWRRQLAAMPTAATAAPDDQARAAIGHIGKILQKMFPHETTELNRLLGL